MGLDMYARSVPANDADAFQSGTDTGNSEEIQYWRKHPNLHGWMQKLHVEKGGDPDPSNFNCVPLRLTPEDIDRLEDVVRNDKLPETNGFFFGQSHPDDKKSDLEFIKRAREAFAQQRAVFYNSWW